MRPEIKATVRAVLDAEGLRDWTFSVHPTDAYCWRDRKHLEVMEAMQDSPGMWLHEIAHALAPLIDINGNRISGDQHWGYFADVFSRLVSTHCQWTGQPNSFRFAVERFPDADKLTRKVTHA